MNRALLPPAFVTPALVDETFRALLARGRANDEIASELARLGGAALGERGASMCALVDVEDVDLFPRLNLGDDVNAPTCTRDLPLRAWLKRRLRERGPALAFGLRSFARDVVCNLHFHYLRDGRRDFVRGAALVDEGVPLGFGDASAAVGGASVRLVTGVSQFVAAVATEPAQLVVGATTDRARAEIETFLRARGAALLDAT